MQLIIPTLLKFGSVTLQWWEKGKPKASNKHFGMGSIWKAFFNLKSDSSVSLFIYYACTNSVTPSLQQARVCPPNMLPEDGINLYSARGILSFIQSSTRRAYQQVLDVLDENRRWLAVTGSASFCCFVFLFSFLVDFGFCLHNNEMKLFAFAFLCFHYS